MTRSRGFSIIELLVVMLIIALVIAIVLPALSGTRTVAKSTATSSLLGQLSQAIGSYETSNRRLPGPFTPREMGSPDNASRGMSAMENIMIDLVGYEEVPAGQAGSSRVGPTNNPNEQRSYNFTKTPSTGAYFSPEGKYFVKQPIGTGQMGAAAHGDIPDLVDSFGTPILAWLEDDTAGSSVAGATGGDVNANTVAFARDNSRNTAKFYLNQNECFLSATQLGQKKLDVTDQGRNPNFLASTIPPVDRQRALAAILGNTAYPAYRGGATDRAQWSQIKDIFPAASRGKFVIQAAGPDGLYLGKKSSAANKGAAITGGQALAYGFSFMGPNSPNAANGHTDANRNPTTIDLTREFDDLFVSGN